MRLPFQSLRMRLSTFSAIILTVLWSVFSLWLYLNLQHSLLKGVDDTIKAVGEQISGLMSVSEKRIRYHRIAEAIETGGTPAAASLVQILDGEGKVVDSSEELEGSPLPVDISILKKAHETGIAWSEVTFGGKHLREVSMPVRGINPDQLVVQVAMPLTEVDSALMKTRWILLVTIPLGLVLACLTGWWLAGKALKPVAQITERARSISAHDLKEKLDIRGNDELSLLAQTLNETFYRLDMAFTALDEAYRQIKRFSADASHELRTPLTSLRGEAEVVLRQPRSQNEYREALEHILKESERMSKIVEDLMLLTQADAGEVIMEKAPLRLDLLIREVIESFLPLARQKGVEIATINLPTVVIIGDETYLFRLFANLIDNAVKYTPEGGQITISAETKDQLVQVTVSDTGPGIAAEHLAHLTERFYRVDKARSRQMGGSGLGLSIVQWIAQSHQGRIEVESSPGNGSSFHVSLPIPKG